MLTLNRERFPSPCGDYGSYQYSVHTEYVTYDFEKFPSPCGDYGSYRHPVMDRHHHLIGWRFPSPCGDYGSYLKEGSYVDGKGNNSFRPLAGIMVLIGLTQVELGQLLGMFPSPCGDYGSYRGSSMTNKEKELCFRPLAGIMVLISLLGP